LNNSKIILAGCGNIGRRYLESISKIKNKLFVIVIDTDDKSLDIAKKMWATNFLSCGHDIQFVKKIESKELIVDLVIIATNSFERKDVIKDIKLKTKTDYWILEKILVQRKEDLEIIKFYTSDSKNVWVNMPRREMRWFKKLKKKFHQQGPLSINLRGGLWEMACCALHYIDLVDFWSGEKVDFIDTTGLNTSWLKSKRPGYFEVTGKMIIKFLGGSELILESYDNIFTNIINVSLMNNEKWLIDEINGTAVSSHGQFLNGKLEYLSQTSEIIIKKILSIGKCELPSLQESITHHSIFLDAMLNHWNYSNKCNDKLVPIT